MARSIRFIHSGDTHLGAPFRGLRSLSGSWADRLMNAIPEAFTRLIDTCIERQVDFLLLAGDIFDTDTVSYAHHQRFLRDMWRLHEHGIPVYLCAGNHDPYANWVHIIPELPPSAHFFPSDKPGYAVFEKDGEPLAHICSRGFVNQPYDNDIAQGITRAHAQEETHVPAPFAIGMLHTGFTIDQRKAPCKESTLLAADMDYWAFGHIHQPLIFTPENPRFAYCGCIQGRDVKETGPRGCLEVTLTEQEKPQVEFVPLASVQWEHLVVDVTDFTSMGSVVRACINAMFDHNRSSSCEEMIVRIKLEGTTILHTQLAQENVRRQVQESINESVPAFFCDSLVDMTISPRDIDALRNESLFESLVLVQADHMQANYDEVTQYVQRMCVDKGLSAPDMNEAYLKAQIERAQELVFDALGDTAHE